LLPPPRWKSEFRRKGRPGTRQDAPSRLDLFEVWRDHYQARLAAKERERRERLAQLWEEHASLPPQERAAVTAQIEEVAREIAELNTPSLPAPLGDWV
jgi:hypothetical protein